MVEARVASPLFQEPPMSSTKLPFRLSTRWICSANGQNQSRYSPSGDIAIGLLPADERWRGDDQVDRSIRELHEGNPRIGTMAGRIRYYKPA